METSKQLIGIHAMVFAPEWNEEGALKAVKCAKEAGFDIIEIPLFHPNIDCEMTVRLLSEYDLTPTCSLGLTSETDISSEDEETRNRGEELLNKALDSSAKIGSKYLGGVLYSTLGKYRKPATAANMQKSADILRRLCARAKELGITIGLEPCNRYETNVINTAAETMEFIDKIGADNAVVHLDTYHMHIEERYEDAVNVCGNRAGYLHIGESHRGILGTGNIDHGRIFKALADANYKGPIVYESFSKDILGEGVIEALAVWKNQWPIEDAHEVAKLARKFIGELLEYSAMYRAKKGANC